MLKRVVVGFVALVLLFGALFFGYGARYVDAKMNAVLHRPPYAVGPAALALHATLRVADMHDDLLLWPRDPLVKGTIGSTDIPRLVEGNVAVEIFSTVSKSPRGQNYAGNSGESDNITLLAIAERRPVKAWRSLLERARWTSVKAHDAAERSNGAFVLVMSASELQRELAARAVNPALVIGVLSLEGLQVLEGRAANLETLYSLGFRMAGLAHFFDNEVAGSAHGLIKGGLTPLGREIVRRMEEMGIIVDLAHVSPHAVDDVLAMATRPVVVSHGGVAAICPGPRNWTDDQLRRLAVNGGVIGIGFWDAAICDVTPRGVARAIKHAVEVAGIDHVGLGSDWDGAITAAFDATGMAQVTEALLAEGFGAPDIARIMGENVIRLLLHGLPPG